MPDSIDRVKQQARQFSRGNQEIPKWLRDIQAPCEYLFWFADYCAERSTTKVNLLEAKSDIASFLYSATLGQRRSSYLHLRSLLENVVWHLYYEMRVGLFALNVVDGEKSFVPWKETFRDAVTCPQLAVLRAGGCPKEGFIVDDRVVGLYRRLSDHVHGSTLRHKLLYRGVSTIQISDDAGEELANIFRETYEACFALLAVFHLGPYILISQPTRRGMLLQMRSPARQALLTSMSMLSLTWVAHQRQLALKAADDGRDLKHPCGLRRSGESFTLLSSTGAG